MLERVRAESPPRQRTETARVHLALFNEPQQPWEGLSALRQQEEIIRRSGPEFALAANPAEAEIIVFLESHLFKNWGQVPALLREELVRAHPEKCYVMNYRADPVDFFPGVYASLPRAQHAPDWSRAGAYYLGNPNQYIVEYENRPWNPWHLFSFRGAMCHPLRGRLLERAAAWGAENPVSRVDRWFDHNEAEQRKFLQEIVDSQFVLCPRGVATSSHRMYEVMRLGRVPVIIADDWQPPRGPDWDSFSITVAENALDCIPSLLRSLQDAAPGMGRRARAAWENWFSPEVVFRHQLNEALDLAEQRRAQPPPDFSRLWHSRQFYRRHGWCLDQRVFRRLRRSLGG